MSERRSHAIDDMEQQYDCLDCGLRVFSIGPRHSLSLRCHECEWLAEIADPVEREQLRAILRERGVIGSQDTA